jgi:hypothetical protein
VRSVSRLLAMLGVGALGAGALAACGDEPTGSPLAPAGAAGDVIVVTSDSALARQLEDPGSIELTLGDGVTVPATTATIAWTANTGELSADVTTALANALGAVGEVKRDAAGAWTVGVSPDSSAGLRAGGYLGDSFMYMSEVRWEQFLANPCDPTSACPGPRGVPDQDTALVAAQRVLDSLGIDRSEVDVVTDVREDGMGVSARSSIAGLTTQSEPDVEVLVGSDGSILQAGGRMTIANQTRIVEVIDAQTATDRAERAFAFGGAVLTRPPIAELPATTSLVPTTAPAPIDIAPGDTVTGLGVGHDVVWDVEGRRWIVPTFTVSTDRNMLFTVFAVSDDMVRIVDAPVGDRDALDGPMVEAPDVAVPAPSIGAPANNVPTASFVPAPTTPLAQPATTAVVPCSGNPPSAQPVINVPPAQSDPVDGFTRDEWGAAMVRSISPVVVGLPTTDAMLMLERACWTVTISYADPTTTFTPDLLWNRIVIVDDGNGRVAAVVFD